MFRDRLWTQLTKDHAYPKRIQRGFKGYVHSTSWTVARPEWAKSIEQPVVDNDLCIVAAKNFLHFHKGHMWTPLIWICYDHLWIYDLWYYQPILLYAEWYWLQDSPCTPWDHLTTCNPSPKNRGRTTSCDKLGTDDVVDKGAPHAWNDGSEYALISAKSAACPCPEPDPSDPANATQ